MKYPVMSFTIDLNNFTVAHVCALKKGDNHRMVSMQICEDGFPYIMDSDCTAVLTATKPDGTTLYNNCSIDGCIVTYEVTEQTSNVVGKFQAEIKIYGADSALVTSFPFFFIVDPANFDAVTVVSQDEFSQLTALVSQAQSTDVLVNEHEAERQSAEAAREQAEAERVEKDLERDDKIEQIAGVAQQAEGKADQAISSISSAVTAAEDAVVKAAEASEKAEDAKAAVDGKQDKTDTGLQTASKTIVGSINELLSKISSHIDDAVKHITASDRSLWNTVTSKVSQHRSTDGRLRAYVHIDSDQGSVQADGMRVISQTALSSDGNTLVMRTATGQTNVPLVPEVGSNATSKQYVDNGLGKRMDSPTGTPEDGDSPVWDAASGTARWASVTVEVDPTLSVEGKAADAKATGERFAKIRERWATMASGEVISVADSSDETLQSIAIYGKSTQGGTPTPENPVEIVSAVNPVTYIGIDSQTALQTIRLPNTIGGAVWDKTLRRIPARSSVTNPDYVDGSGYKWWADKLIVREDGTGELVRRVDSISNFTDLVKFSSETDYYFEIDTGSGYIAQKPFGAVSNIAVQAPDGNSWARRGTTFEVSTRDSGTTGNIRFYCDKTVYAPSSSNVANANWLNSKNCIINCIRSTPVTTLLTVFEVQEMLGSAQTYYPSTTVWDDKGCWQDVGYVADPKNYIDGKLAQMQAAINSLEV